MEIQRKAKEYGIVCRQCNKEINFKVHLNKVVPKSGIDKIKYEKTSSPYSPSMETATIVCHCGFRYRFPIGMAYDSIPQKYLKDVQQIEEEVDKYFKELASKQKIADIKEFFKLLEEI
jgi:hypothetical protein